LLVKTMASYAYTQQSKNKSNDEHQAVAPRKKCYYPAHNGNDGGS